MPNLVDAAWSHAEATPDRVALRGPERAWTYGELRERATAVADLVRGAGLRIGDRALLVAPSVPEFAFAYYGLHAAGVIVVAVNTMSTRPEVEYVLEDAGCSLVLGWHEAGAAAREAAEGLGIPYRELRPALEDVPRAAAGPPHDAAGDDTAVILYTSGTTGRPKGAELTHDNLAACASVFAEVLELTPDEVAGTALPLFHIFGQAVVMGSSLRAGGSVSLLPRFDPVDLLRMVRRDGVTLLAGVPTMWNAMLHAAGDVGPEDVATLRLAASGGASLPPEVLRAFGERFGCVILEGYGLTETTGAATFNGLHRQRKPGMVGIALPGCEVRIDGDDEVGEVLIRGPVVMKGYWNRPEATAETLIDGWLRTGDLGSMDADGDLKIVDRTKDLIIRGGYNVYPSEVETVLYEHADIVEVAVVGVPDEHYGEEVAAVVALRPGATLTLDDLRAWAKERLSAYKVPRRLQLVEALPKGPTGKILKRAIDREALTGTSSEPVA